MIRPAACLSRPFVLAAFVSLLLGTMLLLSVGCGSHTQPAYSINRMEPPGFRASRMHAGSPRTNAIDMPPGALPGLDEELWVITRAPDASARDERAPGSGALLVPAAPGSDDDDGDNAGFVPVPLEHTDVRARIEAFVASVVVEQRFANPFDRTIEASYVFPLPEDAAITGFLMEIGDRRIRAVLRDRDEAEQTYQAARAAGHTAALLTQERPNIFTQRVANIAPGRAIDVRITYFHVLPHEDGWYEYVFPMVVGPRFNPPSSPDPVEAVARGMPAASSGGTSIPYLHPGERSGHDIDLAVEIVGAPVAEILSPSHDVAVVAAGEDGDGDGDRPAATDTAGTDAMIVRLAAHDRIPNRDFRLRFRTADASVRTSLLVAASDDASGGHFALVVQPPRELESHSRAPIEMVFVVDCSGSMQGKPMAQAKAAILATLDRLRPGDSVQVIRFSDDASAMEDRPIEVTDAARRRVAEHVRQLRTEGGTMMLRGIRSALTMPADVRERRRYVVFLTDGYIGNESEVLAEIHRSLGDSRIFSFGVGSSPNRFLMTRMASMGNGAVAFLGLDEDAGRVMHRFLDRIAHPALSHLAIDWNGTSVHDVHPERLPDLFVGRPVVITGRYTGEPPTSARLSGDAHGYRVETTLTARPTRRERELDEPLHAPSAIRSVWARNQIASLVERGYRQPSFDPRASIRRVALEHGLLSAVTAFVAADAAGTVPGGGDTAPSVPVAVPVPRGVRFETTVPSAGALGAGPGHAAQDAASVASEAGA